MGASELSTQQLDELRRDLENERTRLEESLKLTREGAKPVQLSKPIGRLSRMDAIQQQQMTKASRASYATKLRQIEASLEAHRKGEYGYCRACEEAIGYRRLKARPETPFCLSCQDERE
jgi:DnaK suppressor protein